MKTATEPSVAKPPAERAQSFTTISGRPIERLYTAEDVQSIDYARDVADPGVFPYTRGIHATGYRGKLWTMRQFAGFGTPEDTNARYKTLLNAGGTGLSVVAAEVCAPTGVEAEFAAVDVSENGDDSAGDSDGLSCAHATDAPPRHIRTSTNLARASVLIARRHPSRAIPSV